MIQAGSMGIPFVPTYGYAGTDVFERRQDDFKLIPNPFDPEEQIVIARAINPDVVMFHGAKADRRGNVLLGKGGDLVLLAQAARRVIVTVEEIVDQIDPEEHGHTWIPAIHVTAVAHVPFGAFPTAAPGYYKADEDQIHEYVAASQSDEAFEAYLKKYVSEPGSHEGYLERVGLAPAREAVAR